MHAHMTHGHFHAQFTHVMSIVARTIIESHVEEHLQEPGLNSHTRRARSHSTQVARALRHLYNFVSTSVQLTPVLKCKRSPVTRSTYGSTRQPCFPGHRSFLNGCGGIFSPGSRQQQAFSIPTAAMARRVPRKWCRSGAIGAARSRLATNSKCQQAPVRHVHDAAAFLPHR